MSVIKQTPASKPPAHRKQYAPPRLVSYGPVKDIVQGNTGSMNDSGATKAQCWIAEALYGVEDPRTLTLRWWLTSVYDGRQRGWMFVALYRRIGRRVAASIRAGRLPRRALLPLFDVLAEKAFDASARMVSDARPRRAV